MNDNIKIGADINAGDGGYSEGTQEKYDEFVKGRNQSLGKMRILELADQAAEGMAGLNIPDEFCEKFALLIVKECARVIDRGDGEMSSMAETSWCNICRDDILNHFGVKK